MKFSVDEQLKIIARGAVEIIPEEELKKKLERSVKENRPLKVKWGADPSAPDIHLGHTVPLRKLRQFQELGHEVYFLIGDFTAMIGDPTGKSETRKQLTREEVLKNAETYKQQIFKILDPARTKIVFNSEWCSGMKFADVLKLSSQYSVARMLERDDFAKRYKEGRSISIVEFMYPLIQGYDSVALHADIEVGGTEQKFNLLVGRDLQTAYGQEPQVILTVPIIEGTDGVQKMSKSLGNYIGVTESPKDVFGKVMSIPDNLIAKYFELLTDVTIEQIREFEKRMKSGENPRDFKVQLGQAIVGQLHSMKDAEEVLLEFERVFKEKGLPDDMPEYAIKGEMNIVDIVIAAGLMSSKSEMRRLIKQNAVSVDGEKITEEINLAGGREKVIKVGKRIFLKVK
ncbi:MAG: tyrosine--tRNA ligase [Brevinematales bacterium]|nr:tyrosine--tRNA ligase [Brevinematales bacterium]